MGKFQFKLFLSFLNDFICSRFFFIFSVMLGFTSCSPSSLTGNTKDKLIENSGNFSLSQNTKCKNLKLDHETLDENDFLILVDCLNENNEIKELASFFHSLNQKGLQSFVQILNAGFIKSENARSDLLEFLLKLKQEGELENSVKIFGNIFNEPEKLSQFFQSFFDLITLNSLSLKKEPLKINLKNAQIGIYLFEKIVQQKSFKDFNSSFQKILKTLSQDEKEKGAKALSEIVNKALKSKALQSIKLKSNSSNILSKFRGDDENQFKDKSPLFLLVLKNLLQNKGENLNTVTTLISSLQNKVDCMAGGRVFDNPWEDITKEFKYHRDQDLRKFTTSFAATVGLGVQSFCNVPRTFYKIFPEFYKCVATNWGEEALKWVQILNDEDLAYPLSLFLVEIKPELETFIHTIPDSEMEPLLMNLSLILLTLQEEEFKEIGNLFSHFEWNLKDGMSVLHFLDAFSSWTSSEDLSPLLGQLRIMLNRSNRHPTLEMLNAILVEKNMNASGIVLSQKDTVAFFKALKEMSQNGKLSSLLIDVLKLFQKKSLIQNQWEIENELIIPAFHHLSLGEIKIPASELKLSEADRQCLKINYDLPFENQFKEFFSCQGSPLTEHSSFAALERLNHHNFFKPLFNLFTTWPWSAEEFKVMLPGFSEILLSNEAYNLLNEVKNLIPKNVSNLSNILKNIELKSTLQHLGLFFREPKPFQILNQMMSKDHLIYRSPDFFIKNKISEDLLNLYLMEKECIKNEPDLQTRKNIILDSSYLYQKKYSLEDLKTINQFISSQELKTIVGSFFERILSKDSVLMSLLHFIHENSQNAELISLYAPASHKLNVSYLSGLDQLEALLNESNFKLPFFENFAEKFIREFALAWGDTPRDQWPDEIKKMYSTRTPKTLDEVVEELSQFLSRYEKLAGFPDFNTCEKSGKLPREPSLNEFPTEIFVTEEIKSKIFNIHKLFQFIVKNKSTGMKDIREIAFVFWKSESIDKLLLFGKFKWIHAVSTFFSPRVSSEYINLEFNALTHLRPLKDSLNRLISALPIKILSEEKYEVSISLMSSELHRTIDLILELISVIDPTTVQLFNEALIQSIDQNKISYQEGFKKLFNSLKTQSDSKEWLKYGSQFEAHFRPYYYREVSDKKNAFFSALQVEFNKDTFYSKKDYRLFCEVIRLTLQNFKIPSFKTDLNSMTQILKSLKELISFLAEEGNSPRQQAADKFRKQILSASLTGDTLERWIDYFKKDPLAAQLVIDDLLTAFRSNDFKDFLITAGRQLPHSN